MKRFIVGLLLVTTLLSICSCGTDKTSGTRRLVSEAYDKINYAYIRQVDGTIIEGPVSTFTLDSSGIVSVEINGKFYATSATNATLIYDPTLDA